MKALKKKGHIFYKCLGYERTGYGYVSLNKPVRQVCMVRFKNHMNDIVVEPDSSLVIKAAFICLKFSLSLFVKDISLDINFQFFFQH